MMLCGEIMLITADIVLSLFAMNWNDYSRSVLGLDLIAVNTYSNFRGILKSVMLTLTPILFDKGLKLCDGVIESCTDGIIDSSIAMKF